MLTVVTGPMFAGKSERLISICLSNGIAGNKVQAFKPRRDDRHPFASIRTHSGSEYPATIVEDDLTGFLFIHTAADVYVFDEAQFFDSDSLWFVVKQLLFKYNKSVVVGGLCQDSFGKQFGAMPTILSMADEIILLKAVCAKCKRLNSASRTYRKTDSKEQTVVGGVDIYEPRCFDCWKKATDEI